MLSSQAAGDAFRPPLFGYGWIIRHMLEVAQSWSERAIDSFQALMKPRQEREGIARCPEHQDKREPQLVSPAEALERRIGLTEPSCAHEIGCILPHQRADITAEQFVGSLALEDHRQ